MFLFKNFVIFFKYILKARWVIKLPKKNKFVLVDGDYNPFVKYIPKKKFTILYRRGEEINLSILLKCLIKFKFTVLDYCAEFIKCVSPKLILSAFDYYTLFYKLSKKTGIKTLMLQKGKRVMSDRHIVNARYYFPKNSKKIFFVDYSLVYNSAVKEFYSKKIGGNFFKIGNFENNFSKPRLNKQKKEIVFISNFNFNKLLNKSENEDLVAFHLNKLATKNNIKFNILPRFRKNLNRFNEEKVFYNKIIKSNLNFILNKKKTSYDILLDYKYIFATYSSLAQECLVKGSKVGLLCIKSNKSPVAKFRFGLFEKLSKNGLFWTASSKINIKEIERVFNFVIKTKYSTWIKKTKLYSKKIMDFDYGNKVFKKIVNKY